MNLKKTILPLALALIPISYANPLADPFFQTWSYFDGAKTYSLTIRPSAAPGKDYHIAYTFPGGDAATDMCSATSGTSFQCDTGETITRDDSQYSVKLVDRGTTYVFYDPKHMPDTGFIFGNWTYHYQKGNYNATATITILKGANDAQYNVITGFKDNQGSICSLGDSADAYKVTKNPDGTELITLGEGSLGYAFKYDPQKKQIVNPNPGRSFEVGVCAQIPAEWKAVFTK